MLDTLSDKQKEVVAHGMGSGNLCLAGGAVRSGKTFATILGFSIWCLAKGKKHEHAIVGQSIESVMRNAGFPLLEVFKNIGIPAKLTRDLGTRIVVPYDGREINIWIIGAGDERARRRIQGATLMGLVIDEAVILPESFFIMALSRQSVSGGKIWCTYNPDGPRHWFKIKVVDRIKHYNGKIVNFSLDDNPTLCEEVKERFNTTFTGHWHSRMVEGRWAGASGLIFPMWEASTDHPSSWAVDYALDWGVSTIFAALAIRHKGRDAIVVDELYHDARKQEVRTEAEHLEAFNAWALSFDERRGAKVWLDPSTPESFKQLLRRRGFVPRNADNKVISGLVTTCSRLSHGEIKIHSRCKNLINELATYTWDEKKSDIGEDAPIKSDDHGCDALRYYAHSTGKAYRYINPTSTIAVGF